MNPIKKLASQTAIYGVSSIVGRFLNYLLVPIYTRVFDTAEYGVVSEFYAYTGFLTVLLTFGMETGYFRFSRDQAEDRVYSTTLIFLSGLSILFVLLSFIAAPAAGRLLHYSDHLIYFKWFGLLLAFDTIGAIPFARLRQENKPRQFAGIKLLEIGVNIGLNLFFIVICKRAYDAHSDSVFAQLYSPAIGVGYVFIANLVASGVKLILLSPQLQGAGAGFDMQLMKKLLAYSLPMVVIGLAGVTNEMLDRAMLPHYLTGTVAENREQTGIYGGCYKLSILMSLFIQSFRFAAEPFFFTHSTREGSRQTIADVMHWFVVFCCFIFLLVSLYLDFFAHLIGASFRVGLGVVPILLLANLFLGIYTYLSVWYKLSDRTMLGAYVSIGGAVVTIALNILWIPIMGYMGSAYATLVCYAAMAAVSYFLGQHYYPVPYSWLRMLIYVVLSILLYAVFATISEGMLASAKYLLACGLMGLFVAFIALVDGKELWRVMRLSDKQ